jgi:hypothetical protein
VSPIAPAPPSILEYIKPEPVKIATPDLIITGESPETPEGMIDLIFQKIGGHEIISISRSENVNGQNVSYQPIKNIGELSIKYDSKTIIPLPNSSEYYDKAFAINLASKIPSKGIGFSGTEEDLNVYVVVSETEDNSAVLVIESANLATSERLQVEIIKSSDVFNDTIYKVKNDN